MNRSPISRRAVAAGLAAALAAAGCSQRHADVTGRVVYRDRPVVYGVVSVVAADHMTYYGTIQPDGTYAVRHVPVGPARFGVYSPDPYFEPPVPAAVKARIEEGRRAAGIEMLPKPPRGRWVRLPAKYADPLQSPLTGEVTAPASVVDCRLD